MTKLKPPFGLKAMLRLERGTEDAAETLRRYVPLAEEIGADGIDVDVERADLPLSGAFVAVDEERAMHAMARPLLAHFGWREQDFEYVRYHRYAETDVPPPSGPPVTRLLIGAADQDLGWEGATHGTGLTPDRWLEIKPSKEEIVARLFVTVAASTLAASVEALRPWLTRVEPAAICVDPGRAALLYVAHADLRTEAERLGLGPVDMGRIEADADHVIETATATDGTTLWLRRGADPVDRHWPGIITVRKLEIPDFFLD